LGRKPTAATPSEPFDPTESGDVDQEDVELADAADEEAELSDAEFYRQLRQDVAGVREGSVPSITNAMRPPIEDRPWSPRRKRRDRQGKAF